MIGTSIYINRNRLERFQNAAEKLNINESILLSILLVKSRRLFGDKAITGKTVDYQNNDGKSDFVIHHISISETDYELATGRRYIFKISVSFIFALAIDFCLSEIVYEWTKKRAETEQKWMKFRTNIYSKCFSIDHFVNVYTEFWRIQWPRE